MIQSNNVKSKKTFQRFGPLFCFQHIVLMISTLVLIFTGIPLWSLSHPESVWWDAATFEKLGGVQNISFIHRCSGMALILLSVYHLLYTIFSKEGRRDFVALLPKFKDVADVTANSLYFLGLRKDHPKFDRFSYIEKFDYWAVYWGCAIMIVSGASRIFPGVTAKYAAWLSYDLAADIHSGEAVLAALSIFVWHFYNVHFNPSRFPGTLMWFHGKITEEEIKKEHPLEYERIMQA